MKNNLEMKFVLLIDPISVCFVILAFVRGDKICTLCAENKESIINRRRIDNCESVKRIKQTVFDESSRDPLKDNADISKNSTN